MNTINRKKIAIVGGGPGGLTLARLLQLNGLEVKIYERDKSENARPQGATLDLHADSGLLALKKAGLMEDFMANYRPGADRLKIIDKHGKIVLEDDLNKNDELSRPEIDRGPLQKILLDSLLSDTVIWDSHFDSLSAEDNGWKLNFKNGNSAFADIVIAADGGNSKIRSYITKIKPFYAGVTSIEGTVYDSANASPKINALVNGGKIFAFGDAKSLLLSAKGDGSLVFYLTCNKDENWYKDCEIDFSDKNQVFTWFKDEFKGWNNSWDELFENASSNFVVRPHYCMPLNQSWEAMDNLTILGDAAHLMPPFAGEGVNMAMLDALELSNCLCSDDYADIHSAIASYEKHMLVRAAEMAEITMQSTEALHSENAIEFMMGVMS